MHKSKSPPDLDKYLEGRNHKYMTYQQLSEIQEDMNISKRKAGEKSLERIWIGRFYVTGILTTENSLRVSMTLFLRLCCVRVALS